jgi:hypothetical protein
MSKGIFTRKRVKRIALASGGFFCLALTLWAASKAGALPESAKYILEFIFNVSLAIGAFLMIFGVVAPLNTTDIYYHSRSKWLRDRVRNHAISKWFSMDRENSDHE